MKAAVFHGPRDVRVEEVPAPVMLDGDVLIRVRACGICGSDLHTYKHGLFLDLGVPINSGRVLGHEFSGDIEEIRGEVEGLKVGDRVIAAFMGANAEYVRIPALVTGTILKVPPQVSHEEAATNEPLANSIHAVGLAGPVDGQTAVVIGAGIIGLGVVQVLKALHSVRTIVVDLSDKRLAMASQMGADVVINAAREDPYEKVIDLTGATPMAFVPFPAGGVDMVFDCAGVSHEHQGRSSLEQALIMVKENGTVVLVAVSEKPFEFEVNAIMRKGIRLFGSWAWSLEEFVHALDLIGSGKVDRKPLMSHQFPLDAAKEAYETQVRTEEAIKVLIKP
jgi:threonine dehydrogenase-like Zn-dependent dehydrogenase